MEVQIVEARFSRGEKSVIYEVRSVQATAPDTYSWPQRKDKGAVWARGVDILPRGVSLCGLSPGRGVRMWHGTEGLGEEVGDSSFCALERGPGWGGGGGGGRDKGLSWGRGCERGSG